jgi:hypothetical protein
MKRFLACKWMVFGVAIGALLAGLIAGSLLGDAMWLARSGSIAVAMGIFLMFNGQLNGVDIQDVWDGDFKVDDPAGYLAREEGIPEWVATHQSVRMAVERLGPGVTLVGTLVWGFGDLIPL